MPSENTAVYRYHSISWDGISSSGISYYCASLLATTVLTK